MTHFHGAFSYRFFLLESRIAAFPCACLSCLVKSAPGTSPTAASVHFTKAGRDLSAWIELIDSEAVLKGLIGPKFVPSALLAYFIVAGCHSNGEYVGLLVCQESWPSALSLWKG